MKLDYKTVLELHSIMDALSRGKDPFSTLDLPMDGSVNTELLREAFKEAAKIFENLSVVLLNSDNHMFKKVTNEKIPFYLSREESAKIEISAQPISISKFTYNINNSIQRNNMKKIRATQITYWLCEHGYLQQVVPELGEEGLEYKVATNDGIKIGIVSVHKVNTQGHKYVTNMYSPSAQRFILDNVLPQICFII